MSWDKNYRIQCDMCGKYCIPHDEETPFGCKYNISGDPEPLDPFHYCKKCSKILKSKWIEKLRHRKNWKCGHWQKSKAEIEAAKKLKLRWVSSGGVGILGSNIWADSYQYISEREYKILSALPYYGWCEKCGARNKGGLCSNHNCENRFRDHVKVAEGE